MLKLQIAETVACITYQYFGDTVCVSDIFAS